MNRITVDQIMSYRPCYTCQHVTKLWAGRESLTPLEILSLDIPAADAIWALTQRGVIDDDRLLRHFACNCAEHVLKQLELSGAYVDPRAQRAIEVARKYADGQATLGELQEARASGTAYAAIYATAAAYATAATSAQTAAVWAADTAAAYATAPGIEREWQKQTLIAMLQEKQRQELVASSASALGRLGGKASARVITEAKQAASRANGKLGGGGKHRKRAENQESR